MADDALPFARLFDATPLLGPLRRRAAIRDLAAAPGSAGVIALAEALGIGHPNADVIRDVLSRLDPARDGEKLAALWQAWSAAPAAPLGGVLAALGWPADTAVPPGLARAVLAAAQTDTPPESLKAVAALAKALPAGDEDLNDALHAAWVRSQAPDLEDLLADGTRQPGSPVLEALLALATRRFDRYAALEDRDGSLFAQAFLLASPACRERIARGVAASHDRGLMDRFRLAVAGSGVAPEQGMAALVLIGDEDGLVEQCHRLRLGDVVDLVARWAAIPARPTRSDHRAVVDQAVALFRQLPPAAAEPAPALPPGMVDLFAPDPAGAPSTDDLRADLEHGDPFRRARALVLGRRQGLVEAARLQAAAASPDWPERLAARLADPAVLAEAGPDHVGPVSALSGPLALLATPIAGTPATLAAHRQALGAATEAETRGLLALLCLFQGLFVGGAITLDDGGEPSDRTAIALEDAGPVAF